MENDKGGKTDKNSRKEAAAGGKHDLRGEDYDEDRRLLSDLKSVGDGDEEASLSDEEQARMIND